MSSGAVRINEIFEEKSKQIKNFNSFVKAERSMSMEKIKSGKINTKGFLQ